ncbi:MAG: hypothetical protein HC840_27490 [Leptolyngbyaceae cyanobacterium RM2_2_4]|nr:hypothetical protein [Leptolyngbyaceae cyanobacterium RM2_2_4]
MPQLESSTAGADPGSTAENFPTPPPEATGEILSGSILQVLSRQGASGQERWVRLRVCSTPTAEGSVEQSLEAGSSVGRSIASSVPNLPVSNSPAPNSSVASSTVNPATVNPATVSPSPAEAAPAAPRTAVPLQPGAEGWIQEAAIAPHAEPQTSLTVTQQGECATSDSPPETPTSPSASPAAPAG